MYHWVKTILCLVSASLLSLQAFAAGEGERAELGHYFAPATAEPITPDSEGFIRRWTILEPIAKNFSSNAQLTDNFLMETMSEEYGFALEDMQRDFSFKYTDEDILGQGASGGGAGFSATRDDVLTLTFTNAFGNSQHIKVYGNASNDIEYSNVELSVVDGYAISQIVFTITGDQDNRSVWVDQFGAEAAYSEDSLNVTWAGMQNKVILNNLYNTKTLRPKQARIKTIDVTYIKLNETGKTITIETIEKDEFGNIKINGGFEAENGYTLTTEEDTNGWITTGYNDFGTYTERGTVSLELAENVTFTDGYFLDAAALEAGQKPLIITGIEAVTKAIMESENDSFNERNTELVIENGKVVDIARCYTP